MKNLKLFGKGVAFFALLAMTLGVLSGCETTTGGQGGKTTLTGTNSIPVVDPSVLDKLQVGDVVTVIINGIPKQPDPQQQRIGEDGCITLTLVGSYKAVGKTQSQVQDELTQLYSKYFTGHVITVASEGRFFYVTGEVRNPGKAVYIPKMTFSRAIAVAGGYTTFASKKRIRVTGADGKVSRKVNAREIDRNPAKDFMIMPGDIIDVPKR